MLARRRRGLVDRLASDTPGGNLTAGQGIDPGFLRLLADTLTAIAALDAELGESLSTGDA